MKIALNCIFPLIFDKFIYIRYAHFTFRLLFQDINYYELPPSWKVHYFPRVFLAKYLEHSQGCLRRCEEVTLHFNSRINLIILPKVPYLMLLYLLSPSPMVPKARKSGYSGANALLLVLSSFQSVVSQKTVSEEALFHPQHGHGLLLQCSQNSAKGKLPGPEKSVTGVFRLIF